MTGRQVLWLRGCDNKARKGLTGRHAYNRMCALRGLLIELLGIVAMKTFSAKAEEVQHDWLLVDA
ncbi:MAG: hypothetical protein PHS51_03160, partial [Gallionella sp.]|nr:hypothetical protein [Gallionella sp.]